MGWDGRCRCRCRCCRCWSKRVEKQADTEGLAWPFGRWRRKTRKGPEELEKTEDMAGELEMLTERGEGTLVDLFAG